MPHAPTELEQRLHDAIRADEEEYAETAAAALEAADAERLSHVTLAGAARWYAEVAGLRVFPLQPGSKIPYPGSRGCKDATDDVKQIIAWWTTRPTSNIGIATGTVVDVIDIDGPEGVQSWVTLYDTLPPRLGIVTTPNGCHLYIAATEGRGNKARMMPGVDYRGRFGYVVAPCSVNSEGVPYVWRTPLVVT